MKNHIYKYRAIFILFTLFVIRVLIGCPTLSSYFSDQCAFRTLHMPTVEKHVSFITEKFRSKSIGVVRENLPSPHSELLLGVLLGVDDLSKVPKFNDVSVSTGTIHVIVVSGYNISLVITLVVTLIGSKYSRKTLFVAGIITLAYAVIAGFDPPVVRSWLMGMTVMLAKYYGRSLPQLQVLTVVILAMLIINPTYLNNLSFQLSSLATLGLIYYSPLVSNISSSSNVLFSDLITTLSAQVFVWPLIAYKFERVSLISPLVNALVLWAVPLATIIGGAVLCVSLIAPVASKIVFSLLIVPLDIFVQVIQFFGSFSFASIDLKMGLKALFIYYLVAAVIPLFLRKDNKVV